MRVFGESLGLSLPDLFGEYAELAQSILDKAVEAAAIQANAKIARAKPVFAERYGAMCPTDKEAVLGQLKSLTSCGAMTRRSSRARPVSARPRSAVNMNLVDGATTATKTGITSRYSMVYLYANELRCTVCGLVLSGEDELDAASVETSIELEDVNTDEYEDEEWDDDDPR